MVGVDSMVGELRQQGAILVKKIISCRKMEATKQISKKLRVPLGRQVYEYVLLRKIDDIPCILETTYIDCERFPDFDKYYNEKNSMGRVVKIFTIKSRLPARNESVLLMQVNTKRNF